MNTTTLLSIDTVSWDESYLLNITLIDKQHQNFFKLFDDLIILSKEIDKEDKIIDFIEELQKYSINHFRTEEALMKKSNFEGIELHIEQHQLFIRKIDEFKTAHNYNNPILLGLMISFMRKWLLAHISDEDSKYVTSVQNYMLRK